MRYAKTFAFAAALCLLAACSTNSPTLPADLRSDESPATMGSGNRTNVTTEGPATMGSGNNSATPQEGPATMGSGN